MQLLSCFGMFRAERLRPRLFLAAAHTHARTDQKVLLESEAVDLCVSNDPLKHSWKADQQPSPASRGRRAGVSLLHTNP